jgi:hypothetical protein
MRRDLLCVAVVAFLLLSGRAFAFQNAQGQPSQSQAQQQQTQAPATPASAPAAPATPPAAQAPSSQSTTVSLPPQTTDPLVAAARKAREQRKDQAGAKPARVFTNDNIPTQGGVSAVGVAPAADNADGTGAAAGAVAPASDKPTAAAGESAWRERFAHLRKKLEQDQADLELMQRELGVLDVQYYNDPVKSMQQGYSRSDINEKTDKIEAKKKTIEADQQAITDAEEELQRAGGDPGWAR